jgi:hypothetical protein
MRSLVRVCTEAVISTAKCSCLPQTTNSSLPERRPAPAMRMYIHSQSRWRASDPNFTNSWVAGALDSAWRAVYQYLSLYQPDSVMQTFYNEWGSSEYWDETSDEELVKQNRELMERHLVIALHKSGVRLPKETGAEAAT